MPKNFLPSLLLIVALATPVASNASDPWDYGSIPLSDMELSDGTIVKKPFLIRESEAIWINGVVKPDVAARVLAEIGRKPFIEPNSGMAMAALVGLHFRKSHAGEIFAVTLGLYAEDDTYCQAGACKPALLFHRYFCSTILAQKYGIELWGVPKIVSDNSLSMSGRKLRFSTYLDGGPVAEIRIRHRVQPKNLVEFKEALLTLTPNTHKSTRNPGYLSGKKETIPFNPKTDWIWVNPRTDFGKEYSKLGFVPLMIDVIPELEGVQHNPLP